MADKTGIAWADATINPAYGCSPVSPACDNCYAARMAGRLGALTEGTHKDGKWTGRVNLFPERMEQALRWRKPRRIFVGSMTDLFHERMPWGFLEEVFAFMRRAQQHTFLLLTKRAENMRSFMKNLAYAHHCGARGLAGWEWPPRNVWLGVTAENHAMADERIPILLDTPAAKRFVSVEPMLGPVNLRPYLRGNDWDCECGWAGSSGETETCCPQCGHHAMMPPINEAEDVKCPECGHEFYPDDTSDCCPECGSTDGLCACCNDRRPWMPHGISWIICGGESGPDARPMHPDWARGVRNQCAAAGVPFLFKQWGEWAPRHCAAIYNNPDGSRYDPLAEGRVILRDGRCVLLNTPANPTKAYLKKRGISLEGDNTFLVNREAEKEAHAQGLHEVGWQWMYCVGKQKAGRLLDGVEHNAFPEVWS